jgi:hypothetical protein
MSRIHFQSRTILSAAALTAALLATACSDSTSPSAEANGPGRPADPSKPSAVAPTAGGQQGVATTPKPSFLVSTGVQTYNPAYGYQVPGRVTYSPPNVGALDMGPLTPKSISVGGLTVGFLPNIRQNVHLSATFDASLCRWNGSSWVTVATQRVMSNFPYGVRGSVIMPQVNFSTQVAGYYTVTVKIIWWVTFSNDAVISQTFWFNSASDYLSLTGDKVGPGWVYLP